MDKSQNSYTVLPFQIKENYTSHRFPKYLAWCTKVIRSSRGVSIHSLAQVIEENYYLTNAKLINYVGTKNHSIVIC